MSWRSNPHLLLLLRRNHLHNSSSSCFREISTVAYSSEFLLSARGQWTKWSPQKAVNVVGNHVAQLKKDYDERKEEKLDLCPTQCMTMFEDVEKMYVKARSGYRYVSMLMNRSREVAQEKDKKFLEEEIVFRAICLVEWVQGFDPPMYANMN